MQLAGAGSRTRRAALCERGGSGRAEGDGEVVLLGFVGEEADLVGEGVDFADGVIGSEREGEREPTVSGIGEAFDLPEDCEERCPVTIFLRKRMRVLLFV
jgi:hypothetical protein